MSTQALRHVILVTFAFTAIGLLSCGSEDTAGVGATVTITAPGIVGPNAASPVADNPPTLTVTSVTVTDGSMPTYTFQVATDQAFASIVRQTTGVTQGSAQTSWTPGTPFGDGAYFWRAQAVSGTTTGPFSTVAQFIAAGGAATGPGETQIVFDSLTDGTTLGERSGGSFSDQGWRVNTNADFIRYEVPTVVNGYVQWQNVGLTPRGANAASHMLMGMWDPSAGEFRQNPFRVHVQKLWQNPHNPPFMRFRWISQGREHEAGVNFTNWSPGQAYTFRVEWGPSGAASTARVFLDGIEIMTINYNRPYAPNTHFIELGIGERGESVIDAIYRNFSVVRRDS
ncbi:MAG: hypothetical protein BMS9Abin37_0235 [Acidobacteriota bacterium]|nr:MAG: hypothetical protein BMS9Abin37_0235 [Acidobacteriota bacterium]